LRVLRFVYHPHAATAQLLDNAVARSLVDHWRQFGARFGSS
jgi:hypothetical protein